MLNAGCQEDSSAKAEEAGKEGPSTLLLLEPLLVEEERHDPQNHRDDEEEDHGDNLGSINVIHRCRSVGRERVRGF